MSRGTRHAMVAIVGRPNVGKSTLFNRLLGARQALVQDVAGLTRDRHYADCEWDGRPITLIDTGGFSASNAGDILLKQMRTQAQLAMEECELILFVVDGREGLNVDDLELAKLLRKQPKPVLLVVNKADTPQTADLLASVFFQLGLKEPYPVSAEHNLGIELLRLAILQHLPGTPLLVPAAEEAGVIRIALLGRPNVGKSTLANALLKTERFLTSPIPGTTRDALDESLEYEGQRYILTDTAGIRRKSTIVEQLEHQSILRSLRAMEACDICCLIMDVQELSAQQDMRLAELAERRGKAMVFVVNKWDLHGKASDEEAFRKGLKASMRWLSWVPIVFLSAKEGKKVEKLLEVSKHIHAQTRQRFPTPALNRWLGEAVEGHSIPRVGGRAFRTYYCSQVGVSPLSFQFVCNFPQRLPEAYRRYLSNSLRETLGLQVPFKMWFRERSGQRRRQEHVARMKALKRR
ncbi:MAG: ribosome biogenesis GTPase Der [Proteobacteria bacterium]|nr:ribosome biogenesis GTPase Der [Cystobacterineae bacterium]MCL2258354.1 ribosome biogenesis GTPase Der [Cystobacterineae bacterium]MCL2315283.1 ribosome biogenesis GTPase Der [Pseudomonadota bacterium]